MIIKYNSKKILRGLLLLNIVVLMLLNILPYYTGIIRFGVLLLAILLFSFKKSEIDKLWKWQIAFVLYMFLSSLYTYLKYDFFSPAFGRLLVASLTWAWGGYLVGNQNDFLRLYRVLFLCLSFSVYFLLASNVFGFATASGYSYSSENIKFGMSGTNIVKILSVFLVIMLPYLIEKSVRNKSNFSKIFFISVVSIALGFILLGFKRGAILSLVVALLPFFYIYKKKSKILYLGIIGFIFSFVFLQYFSDEFNQVKNERLIITEQDISGESPSARSNEAVQTLETAFSNGPIVFLFGNGMFSEQYYYKTNRMHHTDYFSILYGGGILGIILYFGFYIVVFIEIKKNYRKSFNSYYNNSFYAAAIGLIFAMAIHGISGMVQGIDLRMYSLIFLGATNKFFKIGGLKDDFSVSKLN